MDAGQIDLERVKHVTDVDNFVHTLQVRQIIASLHVYAGSLRISHGNLDIHSVA